MDLWHSAYSDVRIIYNGIVTENPTRTRKCINCLEALPITPFGCCAETGHQFDDFFSRSRKRYARLSNKVDK
jgi:hypothetical protein